jgi:hypothetical protein
VDYNSLTKTIAFILGALLLVAVSWGAFKAVTEAKADYTETNTIETLDTDVALANTIDSLESHWNRRLNYHFNVQQDPLFLGRVIQDFSYAKRGFKELDEGDDLRLSATIILPNDSPRAIIKYRGKSLVLGQGEKFGSNYVIKEIETKKVVLNKNGQNITLHNKPVELEFQQEGRQSPAPANEW